MIEEIYNLRKKNIKLLEELSNSKKEVLHFRNQTIEDQQDILHSIITVLDILDNNGNNENAKIILEKILEKHQVKRIATPSLMISGKANKPAQRIIDNLQDRYCINVICDLHNSGLNTFNKQNVKKLRQTGKLPSA